MSRRAGGGKVDSVCFSNGREGCANLYGRGSVVAADHVVEPSGEAPGSVGERVLSFTGGLCHVTRVVCFR